MSAVRFDDIASRQYHEWEDTIVPRLLREAPAKWPRNWPQQAMKRLLGEPVIPEGQDIFFGAWLCWHAEPAPGITAGSAFRKRRGAELPELAQRWLDSQIEGWITIVEVLDVDSAEGIIRLRDVLTLEEHRVQDRTASRSVRPRAYALARLVPFQGVMFFGSVHMHGLPPNAGQSAAAEARAELGIDRRDGSVKPESLRSEEATSLLVDIWEQALDELANRPLPKLANFDGDPIVFTSDHYAFDPKDRKKVIAALSALEGASTDPASGDRAVISFLGDPPPGMEKTSRRTDIGVATVRAKALIVRTNSVARADALRARVEAACGELIRHRLRDHEDPFQMLADEEKRAERVPSSSAVPPEAAAAVRQYKADYYRDWLDMKIPALGQKTPRAAAKTRAGRAAVEDLLAQMEFSESSVPADQRFDIGVLRKALGL